MAAIESISKRGFSGTTLKHVTQGAKLSHGVVNFHFESKETLYVETLGYIVNEHYELWHGSMDKAGPDPADQLTAVVEADFDKKVCSPKKMAVWFAFWGQAKYRPKYLKIHNKHDEDRFVELDLGYAFIHYGALAGVELCLGGARMANLDTREVSMSSVSMPNLAGNPFQTRAMDKEDIREVRRWH
ncbi:HTH-type transcriptional regulator BetI [Nymphon striatum]|nr:HTH-type transcriptional regulator BetI [Nymphon striatum]